MYNRKFHLMGDIDVDDGGNVTIYTACGKRMMYFAPLHKKDYDLIGSKNKKYVTCEHCKNTNQFSDS